MYICRKETMEHEPYDKFEWLFIVVKHLRQKQNESTQGH